MRRVICLGNELAGDDGVAVRVGGELTRLGLPTDVELTLSPAVGLDLIDLVLDADALVFVDATSTGVPPGTVRRLSLAEVSGLAAAPYCCHALGLPELLRLAARLAPDGRRPLVTVVGIEAAVMDRFGTELSAPVAAAVPVAASAVLGALGLAAAGERAGKPAGEPPLP